MSVTVKLIINNDQLVGDIGFVNGNELVKDLLLSLIDKTSDICEQVTARVKQTLWSHKINFLEKKVSKSPRLEVVIVFRETPSCRNKSSVIITAVKGFFQNNQTLKRAGLERFCFRVISNGAEKAPETISIT